jgi:hypothetical protein
LKKIHIFLIQARTLDNFIKTREKKATFSLVPNRPHGPKNPNSSCTVGRNIQDAIVPLFSIAQLALEKTLANVTIEDVVKGIIEKEQLNNIKK